MKIYQDPEWLYEAYWTQRLTLEEMAGLAKCSYTTLRRWMNHHNIPRRGCGMCLEDRFWDRVDIRGDDECWEWLGRLNNKGYGMFDIDGSATTASRASWAFYHGADIPEGMFVCHHCDNPSCVNPAHLFLGTQVDNMVDMIAKGRSRRGGKQANAKLSSADVLEIRRLWDEGYLYQHEIGTMFGVTAAAIGKIVRRERWGWL